MKNKILISKNNSSNPEDFLQFEFLPDINVVDTNELYFIINEFTLLNNVLTSMENFDVDVDQFDAEYVSWNETEKTVKLQLLSKHYNFIKSIVLETVQDYCKKLIERKMSVSLQNISDESINEFASFRTNTLNKCDAIKNSVINTTTVSQILEIDYSRFN